MPRSRIIGTENEYGILFEFFPGDQAHSNIMSSDETRAVREMEACLDLHSRFGVNGFLVRHNTARRLWLANGGLVYIDSGNHPEYASPECRSVRDAVLYNKAGEEVMRRLFEGGLHDSGGNQYVRFHIFKNNVGRSLSGSPQQDFSTYGCHENYLVYGIPTVFSSDGKPTPHYLRYAQLIPFFITRQIFDGAGWWTHSERNEFALSQRALFMHKEYSETTTGEGFGEGHTNARGIICGRNQSLMGTHSGMFRFHLILGDANMLETALFLKFGTTKLMLAMLEDGVLPLLDVKDSVKALHQITRTRDPNESTVEEFFEGGISRRTRNISPIAIQYRYLEAARHYVAETHFEHPAEEAEAWEIINLWEEALCAIKNRDKEWLVGRIDYETKEWLVEQEIKRLLASGTSYSAASLRDSIDLLYHQIASGSLYEYLKRKGIAKRILTDDEIARAAGYPPRDTRAIARGSFIRQQRERGGFDIKNIDWDSVTIGLPEKHQPPLNSAIEICRMDNPFKATYKWLEGLLSSGEAETLE